MAKIDRFDVALGQVPGRIETAAEQRMFGTLAQRLKEFADRRNTVADLEAQQEGRRAGEAAAAGTIGGVEIPDDITIRNQAFAKGARASHAAALQVDIRQNIADLERNNQNDINAFNTQYEGYKSGLLEQVDESLQPMAVSELADYALRSRVRIEDNIFKRSEAQHMATITTATDGASADALNAAYQGDEQMLLKKSGQYLRLLDQGVEDGVLDPIRAEEQKRAFNDQVDIQNVTGVFDRTIQDEGLDAAEKAFDKFVKAKHRGVDPVTRDKIINKMRSSLSHERSRVRAQTTRQNAELKAREKALKRAVDNANFSLDHGYQVEGLPELIDVSRGTKHEQELRLIQIHQDAVNEFTQKTPSEMTQFLNETGSKKLSGEQARLVERLKKVRDHTAGEIRAGRGMDLALQQGIIADLPPLGAPGALAVRRQHAQTASSHYEQPISPLTRGELDTLKANLDAGTSDERIVTLGQTVDGLGEDALPMLENLAGKNAGTYAVAGSLMIDDQGFTGREMIKGIDARAAYPQIIPKDFNTVFNQAVGTTYARTPKQVEILRDATRNLYAQQSAVQGKFEEAVTDDELLEGALNEITGGFFRLQEQGSGFIYDNRYDIEAPARGVDQDQFIDWMENLTEEEVGAMGNTHLARELTAAINDQQVMLVSLGEGRYQVLHNGIPFVNDDLTPFILRWNQ